MAVFVPLRDDEDRDPPPPGAVDELFDRPLSAEEVTQTILRIEGEALEVAEPVEPEAADFALEPPRRFGFVMGRFRRTGMRLRLAAERVDTPVDLREIADQPAPGANDPRWAPCAGRGSSCPARAGWGAESQAWSGPAPKTGSCRVCGVRLAAFR